MQSNTDRHVISPRRRTAASVSLYTATHHSQVDDLIVNEKPTLLYNTKDADLSPHYKACYGALIKGEGKPDKVDKAIWDDCTRIARDAAAKVKGVHFDQGANGWAMLEIGPDGGPRMPKVPLTDDWLVYKNFKDFKVEPHKNTLRNCLCTPYMYNKYECIFGLTGSVGGDAERAYIRKTYEAVAYEVKLYSAFCVYRPLGTTRVMYTYTLPCTPTRGARVRSHAVLVYCNHTLNYTMCAHRCPSSSKRASTLPRRRRSASESTLGRRRPI